MVLATFLRVRAPSPSGGWAAPAAPALYAVGVVVPYWSSLRIAAVGS
jgi:hypothetical protein